MIKLPRGIRPLLAKPGDVSPVDNSGAGARSLSEFLTPGQASSESATAKNGGTTSILTRTINTRFAGGMNA